jgi:hypothetical protein
MLLAAGCSYTDENFTSVLHPEYDTSYKKWPEIVADKLGVMHKNLGACGAGNDYITKQLTMEILKNHKNITAVMVGWTEIHRFTIFDFYRCNPFATVANHKIPSMQKYKKFEPSHEELALIPFYDLLYGYGLFDKPSNGGNTQNLFVYMIRQLLDGMFQIQELCSTFNIPCINGQLCGYTDREKWHTLSKIYGDIPFSESAWTSMFGELEELWRLNPKNHIGYPFMKTLGGYSINSLLTYDQGHKVSKLDSHPNEKGHQFIADLYYDKYTKTYS